MLSGTGAFILNGLMRSLLLTLWTLGVGLMLSRKSLSILISESVTLRCTCDSDLRVGAAFFWINLIFYSIFRSAKLSVSFWLKPSPKSRPSLDFFKIGLGRKAFLS